MTIQVFLEFAGGNERVRDREGFSAKDQFIAVLDEAEKASLIAEHEKLTNLAR